MLSRQRGTMRRFRLPLVFHFLFNPLHFFLLVLSCPMSFCLSANSGVSHPRRAESERGGDGHAIHDFQSRHSLTVVSSCAWNNGHVRPSCRLVHRCGSIQDLKWVLEWHLLTRLNFYCIFYLTVSDVLEFPNSYPHPVNSFLKLRNSVGYETKLHNDFWTITVSDLPRRLTQVGLLFGPKNTLCLQKWWGICIHCQKIWKQLCCF